jgi:hypothetical protein
VRSIAERPKASPMKPHNHTLAGALTVLLIAGLIVVFWPHPH